MSMERMRMRMMALLLSAALGACSSVPQNAEPPSLDGTAWVLSDLPGRALPPGQPPTLQFQAGTATGSDGCNRYTAQYTSKGGALAVSPGAMTRMACPEDRMQLADAFMAALTGAKRYRVSSGTLDLLGADGAVLATLATQVRELAGTSWQATGINNGKGGVVSVASGSTVSLAFGTDGRASGSAGCNGFNAGYTAEGSNLRFTPAAVTQKMCIEAGVMEQEAAFLKALESVATSRVEADQLELRRADGALAATFTRDAGA
jgi:heat shock protein HslJ